MGGPMTSLFSVLTGVCAVFVLAYMVFGRYLGRVLDVDDDCLTPAHEQQDDTDQLIHEDRTRTLLGHQAL
jgi:carbon starvation protein CstA